MKTNDDIIVFSLLMSMPSGKAWLSKYEMANRIIFDGI